MLREGLKLTGTKFGCGAGLCGACMVHIDGKRAFSCQTQISEVAGKSVTAIEGLSANSSRPVQKARLAENVPQCGYCQSGQIMSAADLLKHNPKPTHEQIVEHMSTNICRCGTYRRIIGSVMPHSTSYRTSFMPHDASYHTPFTPVDTPLVTAFHTNGLGFSIRYR